MKIGIITFHWATNYGAVLQSYALQTFLESMGHDVEIINYKPKNYNLSIWDILLSRRVLHSKKYFRELQKEEHLKKFRKSYLQLTKRFFTIDELQKDPPDCDIYIAGSDQIWNPFFTLHGEGKPTSTYFLDFGDPHIKRIGYAVSFGCTEYPLDAQIFAEKYVPKFDFIFVRENTGLDILEKMNFKNRDVVLDPTLLIAKENYESLIVNEQKLNLNFKGDYIFSYILRNQKIVTKLKQTFLNIKDAASFSDLKMEDWLSSIKNANFVVTNSYHGTIFCILFHTPFVVLLDEIENIGMNDRFYTLLDKFNLSNRICQTERIDIVQQMYENENHQFDIQWDLIDAKKMEFIEETKLSFSI